MKLAVVLCVLGVFALADAATLRASDNFGDVIHKFLPGLVEKARAEGGTIKERYMMVDLAYYDLARALVNLRAAEGLIDDAPRRLDQIQTAENLDIRLYGSGP
ncbi:hypothetical protein Pmani_002562 [Petrolisthes manimaculis]|uniref:Uncharacterized protein n=1 Tax=Petrolisthes manimaculis TaxID=1843537 RepID=A0AAE1UQW5_9EUCA|nr:hypothetical protein Pmani_002562 [Petrolisthes manimaculis]